MSGTEFLVRVGDEPYQPVREWRHIGDIPGGGGTFDLYYQPVKGDGGQTILSVASVYGDSVDIRLRFPTGDVFDMAATVKVSQCAFDVDQLHAYFRLAGKPTALKGEAQP